MRTIKLMPDYDCYPLWGTVPEEFGDIAPSDLPISELLQEDLLIWASKYDAILNRDDPASSGFKSQEDERKFIEEGAVLADRLRNELGDGYRVLYYYYDEEE